MSTHAVIIRKSPTEEKTYEYVYVHYDGYPQKDGVGDVLMNHVKDNQQEINRIFDNGDLRYIEVKDGKLIIDAFDPDGKPEKVHFIIDTPQEESRYVRKIMQKNSADFGYIFDDTDNEWRYYQL